MLDCFAVPPAQSPHLPFPVSRSLSCSPWLPLVALELKYRLFILRILQAQAAEAAAQLEGLSARFREATQSLQEERKRIADLQVRPVMATLLTAWILLLPCEIPASTGSPRNVRTCLVPTAAAPKLAPPQSKADAAASELANANTMYQAALEQLNVERNRAADLEVRSSSPPSLHSLPATQWPASLTDGPLRRVPSQGRHRSIMCSASPCQRGPSPPLPSPGRAAPALQKQAAEVAEQRAQVDTLYQEALLQLAEERRRAESLRSAVGSEVSARAGRPACSASFAFCALGSFWGEVETHRV